MILDSSCVHYWIIGKNSIGRCKKCGAIRDFEQLKQEEEEVRRTIHKKKSEVPPSVF